MTKEKMKRIDAQVLELLKSYGYSTTADDYVDVVKFARWKGFSVGNAKLEDGDDGFIIIQPDVNAQTRFGPMIIGVNADRDRRFKRFVISHELGHWKLHYQGEGLYRHRDDKKERSIEEREREEEADYFAAALLMPAESFRRRKNDLLNAGLPRSEVSIRLARIYDAPLESVLRREEELAC